MTGRFAERQAENNALSRDRWALYQSHRQRVTRMVLQGLPEGGGRVCVLGAGNCNDLDLAALLGVGVELHLVDLDWEALEAGVAAQGQAGAANLVCHGGVDLSGCLDLLEDRQSDDPSQPLIDALSEARPALPAGPFDLVLSACLLTQMIEPLIESLGAGHADLAAALRNLRQRHVEILIDLLAPEATAFLVSDLVSTDSAPEIASTPEDGLADLTLRLLEARNFFSGANPFALLKELEAPGPLHDRLARTALSEPWIWPFSPERSYLVTALALQYREDPSA